MLDHARLYELPKHARQLPDFPASFFLGSLHFGVDTGSHLTRSPARSVTMCLLLMITLLTAASLRATEWGRLGNERTLERRPVCLCRQFQRLKSTAAWCALRENNRRLPKFERPQRQNHTRTSGRPNHPALRLSLPRWCIATSIDVCTAAARCWSTLTLGVDP
ncbi:hypothetical protein Hypma_001742 [Hypsizygus marmoreus]|uniref:Uncharacterized protein n=1 Tax=Hypsizygus marmoreus TaxID=39966 RepID=A0A369JCR4_HYPMA|nr:hypothetical protein Hypma_001742 [Hypsizygus marmoreus]